MGCAIRAESSPPRPSHTWGTRGVAAAAGMVAGVFGRALTLAFVLVVAGVLPDRRPYFHGKLIHLPDDDGGSDVESELVCVSQFCAHLSMDGLGVVADHPPIVS